MPKENPLKSTLQGLREQLESGRAARQAWYLEASKPICVQYGLDAVQDEKRVRMLLKAQARQKDCQECNGLNCRHGGIRDYEGVFISPEGEVHETDCPIRLQEKMKMILPGRYAKKTFADYEVTVDNKRAVGYARWFLDKGNRGLYFYGGYGTGKTFLASLVAKECILRGERVVFGNVPQLMGEIQQTFKDPTVSSQEILGKFIKCDLLILDDIGLSPSKWNVGIICQILDERNNAERPVIMTSNFSPEKLQECFAKEDSVTAGRIASRLKQMCYVASLGAEDRRQ